MLILLMSWKEPEVVIRKISWRLGICSCQVLKPGIGMCLVVFFKKKKRLLARLGGIQKALSIHSSSFLS